MARGGIAPDRSAPLPLRLEDVLQLKKPHPCGSDRWRVLRVGADIRLRCERCGRVILVPRSAIERRVRRMFPAAGTDDPAPAAPTVRRDSANTAERREP